jgi:hypothetical protein
MSPHSRTVSSRHTIGRPGAKGLWLQIRILFSLLLCWSGIALAQEHPQVGDPDIVALSHHDLQLDQEARNVDVRFELEKAGRGAQPAGAVVYLVTPLPSVPKHDVSADWGRHVQWVPDEAERGGERPVWIHAAVPARRDADRESWSASVPVPESVEAGHWRVLVRVDDESGRPAYAWTDRTVQVAASVTSPPVVVSATLSPGQVEVSLMDQTVTANVGLRVTGATILLSYFYLKHSVTEEEASGFGFAERVSGTDSDGTWRQNIILPRYANGGVWELWVYALGSNWEYVDTKTSAIVTVIGTSDTQPPALVGNVTLTPASVDLTPGPQTVEVSARLTDDVSGVDYVRFEFERGDDSFSGSAQLKSGDPMDGVWEGRIEVPMNVAEGAWTLYVVPRDKANNRGRIPANRTLQVSGSDTTPARLSGNAMVTPSSVDVSGGEQVVRVRIPVADDHSGVEYVSPYFVKDYDDIWGDSAELVSGDARDGVWEADVVIPQNAADGVWRLHVMLNDVAGNFADLTTTAALVVGGADTRAPTLTGTPTIVPASVNVLARPVPVTITAALADDLSGVGEVVFVLKKEQLAIHSDPAGRVTGSIMAGTWAAEVTIPRNAEKGEWVLHVEATDAAGNSEIISTSVKLTVLDSDTSPPRLVAEPFVTPRLVDVSSESQNVTVSASVRDSLSGVESVAFRFARSMHVLATADAALVSGDSTEGTWRAVVSIPRAAGEGEWDLVAILRDRAGNTAHVTTPSVLHVGGSDTRAPQLTALPVVTPNAVDLSTGANQVRVVLEVSDD